MGQYDTQLFINPRARKFAEYGPEQREIINQEAFAVAKVEITNWPGYERSQENDFRVLPRPVHPLPAH